ncbi:MAG: Lrp/AsnC ligand binding domain-containing protein [Candidatus Poseidoniaceae archaeon]|nr:Lrp/AsnC ligand binding domain-containing protein [Candidatus Poseidoniaceae archaeon]MBL6896276.1 Lrp/AsnC ligand binding domain-containing protein [Candidatus Poseidoniaceae archaeon]
MQAWRAVLLIKFARLFDFHRYFTNYALGDEYFAILHYLPSTGHNDSMAVGYVLVNVTPGMEIEAYNKIKGMKHVDDITVLFGDYDLIIKLVADDLASIAKTVVETIRPVQGVINTKTLAGADI